MFCFHVHILKSSERIYLQFCTDTNNCSAHKCAKFQFRIFFSVHCKPGPKLGTFFWPTRYIQCKYKNIVNRKTLYCANVFIFTDFFSITITIKILTSFFKCFILTVSCVYVADEESRICFRMLSIKTISWLKEYLYTEYMFRFLKIVQHFGFCRRLSKKVVFLFWGPTRKKQITGF